MQRLQRSAVVLLDRQCIEIDIIEATQINRDDLRAIGHRAFAKTANAATLAKIVVCPFVAKLVVGGTIKCGF